MKKKIMPILLALIFVIGGSAVLYNYLSNRIEIPNSFAAREKSTERIENQELERTENQESEQADSEKVKAPDFTMQDSAGNDIKLSDMLGKPIVLNFWASWCPPCKSEMPDFNKVFEELGEDVHFMMLDAVDGVRETKEKGEAYVLEQGFTFPVYYDMGQEAVMQYGIRAFPTTIFIDSEGYLVTGVEGAIDEKALRGGIDLILSE